VARRPRQHEDRPATASARHRRLPLRSCGLNRVITSSAGNAESYRGVHEPGVTRNGRCRGCRVRHHRRVFAAASLPRHRFSLVLAARRPCRRRLGRDSAALPLVEKTVRSPRVVGVGREFDTHAPGRDDEPTGRFHICNLTVSLRTSVTPHSREARTPYVEQRRPSRWRIHPLLHPRR
jgi:hypothetical protein